MQMNLFEIISGVLLLITGIVIIVLVILQESKQEGMSSAISGGGGGDSYFEKNKPKTKDAFFGKMTKIFATVFFMLTILISVATLFMNGSNTNPDIDNEPAIIGGESNLDYEPPNLEIDPTDDESNPEANSNTEE